MIKKFLSRIKLKRALKLVSTPKLHLGCGPNVLPGWLNLDLEPGVGGFKCDLTQRLPIPNNAIEYIYSEHFIEHLEITDAEALLRECYRVLKPQGVIRISTPDLRKLLDEYYKKRTTEWHDVGWTPLTPCRMVNEGMRLWGHKFVYDSDELQTLIQKAGFIKVRSVKWRDSQYTALQNLESRPFHGELIFEADKAEY